MRRTSRYVSLDICDYDGNTLCNLFDSSLDASGQAYEVYCKTQRNGFKELRFKLPSVCHDEEGKQVDNFRIEKLISDYRIRTKKRLENGTFETDWFLINEEKIVHSSSKNYEVRASHISQLLRTKNLDLEFSESEGNNVGTILQIAETILSGTGWHLGEVSTFYEEDKFLNNGETKEKVRTFNAAAKTGAFKMMSDLCDLFDAKVLYHGEGLYQAQDDEGNYLVDAETGEPIMLIGRTVDISPMNPFSKDVEPNTVPKEVLKQKKVLELHYSKNVKNVSRTMKTDNLVTKLSAYGSYGDLNGLCSLQTVEHAKITFSNLEADTNYYFIYNDMWFYFRTTATVSSAKWSALDYVSRSYLYYYDNEEIKIIKVFKEKIEDSILIEGEVELTRNYFPFVMDFSYYQKIGLLTDSMLQSLAEYQIDMPSYYAASEQASTDLINTKSELMKTASDGEGYLKLDIESINYPNNYIVLNINTLNYPNGIIYRSDYGESKRNWFTWRSAIGIKENGEAISAIGSVVYLVRNGEPTKWIKSYIKFIGNNNGDYFIDQNNNRYVISNKATYDEDVIGVENVVYIDDSQNRLYIWKDEYIQVQAANYEFGSSKFDAPTKITLWKTEDDMIFNQFGLMPTDTVYMFSANSIAGMFGPREDSVESNIESVKKSVQVVSEEHPFNIINKHNKDDNIDISEIPEKDLAKQNYGWCYVVNQYHYKETPESEDDYYKFGQLYFLWGGVDTEWSKVYVSFDNTKPSVSSGYAYYYNAKYKHLFMLENNEWTRIRDTVDDDNVVNAFGIVVSGCIRHEIYVKGIAESYTYHGTTLPVGNYAFKNEFNSFWLFTTDIETDTLRYITSGEKRAMWQSDSDRTILKPSEYTFDVITFAAANELEDAEFANGEFDETNRSFSQDGDQRISGNIYVYEDVIYQSYLPAGTIIVYCNKRNVVIGKKNINNLVVEDFITPIGTTHIRIVYQPNTQEGDYFIRVKDYNNKLFIKNIEYTLLPSEPFGNRNGLPYLMDRFISLSDTAYLEKLPILQESQKAIKLKNTELMETLGDMYREGRWQETNYVEGDELKLYTDTLDNLKEISHPETTYEFGFLNLYGTEKNIGLSSDETFEDIDWIVPDITYAAHLVDMDIDTNCWAYIDEVDECYDQEWKTTLSINTKLSNMGQQSFTDVLASIAQVANEVKSKTAIYGRAANISGSGQIAADKIAGMLQTNRMYINAGTSNWYTDSKGNIIFEDANGESAMMLSGHGWAISSSRSVDGDWEWQYIATGKGLSAEAIYTGYLAAERIEAGSITADKLSSTVGHDLEIGSNKALALYATKDGSRPAGSVLTKQDSIIEISTGDEEKQQDGYINVRSGGNVLIEAGGELNVCGGNVNIRAENIEGWSQWISETHYNIGDKVVYESIGYKCKTENEDEIFDTSKWIQASDGNVNISSGGNIFIDTAGTFNVASGNLFIGDKGSGQIVEIQGKIIALTGNIAGFEIGNEVNNDEIVRYYMYAGTNHNSLTSNNSGVYLGTDGINVGGKFIFSADGEDSTLYIDAGGGLFIGNDGSLSTDGITIIPGQINLTTGGTINLLANSGINLASTASIAIASSDENDASAMIINNAGITLVASQSISLAAGNSISLVSGDNSVFSLNETGVVIGSAGKLIVSTGNFTIDSSGNVALTGEINALTGKIANWYISSTHIGSSTTAGASQVGIASDDYSFWAGNSNNRANASFYVKKDGTFKAVTGQIGPWTLKSGYIAGSRAGGSTENASMYGVGIGDSTYAFWAGGPKNGSSALSDSKFYVKNDGSFKAGYFSVDTAGNASLTAGSINLNNRFIVNTNGDLTCKQIALTGGTIAATSGTIQLGNWTFTENGLTYNNGTSLYPFKVGIYNSSDAANCFGIFHKTESDGRGRHNDYLVFQTSGEWSRNNTLKPDGTYVTEQQTHRLYYSCAYNGWTSLYTIAGIQNQTNLGTAEYPWNDFHVRCIYGQLSTNDDSQLFICPNPAYYGDRGIKIWDNNDGSTGSKHNSYTPVISIRAYDNGSVSPPIPGSGPTIRLDLWNGNIVNDSSREYKTNIQQLQDYGIIIDKLNPVSFNYKKDILAETKFGLIYEDTINLIPEICIDNGKNKGISYLSLVPILLNEIKSLRVRLKRLEER